MPDPLATAHDPGAPERPWLNVTALQLAVETAMAQRAAVADSGRFTLRDMCREAQLREPDMSGLLRQGERPSARTLGLLLAWLHLDPAKFMVTGPPAEELLVA